MNENHQVNYDNRKSHGNSNINETNSLIVVGQVLTIVVAFGYCFTIIGLLWGVPMIIGCMKRLARKKEITITHVVLSMIFFWLIGGLLTLIGAHQDKRI